MMGRALNSDSERDGNPDLGKLIIGLCANPEAAIPLDGAICTHGGSTSW